MMELLRAIYPLAMSPVSAGADRAIELLRDALPGDVHEFASGREHNGWIVPQHWSVEKAEIYKDGRLVYDGTRHPLGVIGSSESFQGSVSREELRKHLFHHPVLDDALVYHCDLYYKPWRKDWGFTMPRRQLDALEPGTYQVDLRTTHRPGTMKVYDAFLPGASEETIVLNAHDCHAGQANDDIAGVVVGMEVMRRLAKRRNRYSYRFIVAPEHLGTVFYVVSLDEAALRRIRYGIFLEMLGNDHRIGLQETFSGRSEIDRVAHHYLRHHHPDYEPFIFRKFVGNDETVWEAPGVEVPMIELARFPFPQYHSDQDNETIISEAKLEESAGIVMGILDMLETNVTVQRRFNGLIALSNPKYDLYYPMPDPSLGNVVSDVGLKWNHLMNRIVRYFDGRSTVLEIAEAHELPYDSVYQYIRDFHAKGLVDLALPPWAAATTAAGPR